MVGSTPFQCIDRCNEAGIPGLVFVWFYRDLCSNTSTLILFYAKKDFVQRELGLLGGTLETLEVLPCFCYFL